MFFFPIPISEPAQAELVEARAAMAPSSRMDFHTYILCCSDGSYYVGHTDNLERRVAEHNAGTMGGYTATRRPVSLLWSQRFQTRDDAFAAERQLKGWSRAKKEAMMAGDWELLSQLARGRTGGKVGSSPPRASTSSA